MQNQQSQNNSQGLPSSNMAAVNSGIIGSPLNSVQNGNSNVNTVAAEPGYFVNGMPVRLTKQAIAQIKSAHAPSWIKRE